MYVYTLQSMCLVSYCVCDAYTIFSQMHYWPCILTGLVASVKSQILSHLSLTASGVIGWFFCLTMSPWERSQRTAHMDTHGHTQTKRSLHGENYTYSVQYGTSEHRANEYNFPRKDTQYSHLPIQPAPTWKNLKGEWMILKYRLFKRNLHYWSIAMTKTEKITYFWYCLYNIGLMNTSNSPPFSWHWSWQSQRTRGATYSGFRDAKRSKKHINIEFAGTEFLFTAHLSYNMS